MENSARWSLDILAAEPMLSQRLRVDRRAAAKQISPGCRRCSDGAWAILLARCAVMGKCPNARGGSCDARMRDTR